MRVNTIAACTNAIAEANDTVYFALSNINAICATKPGAKRAEYLYSMKSEQQNLNLFTDIYTYKDKIIFVPYRAKKMLVYDTKKNIFSEKLLPIEKRGEVYRVNTYLYGAKLYFFETSTGRNFIYNIEQDSFACLDEIKLFPSKIEFCSNTPRGMARIQNNLYAPTSDGEIFARISLKSGEIEYIKIPTECDETISISDDGGEKIYILGRNRDTVKLNIWKNNQKAIRRIDLDKVTSENRTVIFHPPVFWNEKLYILPYSNGCKSFLISFEEKCEDVNTEFTSSLLGESGQNTGFWYLRLIDGKLQFQSRWDDGWYIYDMTSEKVLNHWECKLESQKLLEIISLDRMRSELNTTGIILEREGDLSRFLKFLAE